MTSVVDVQKRHKIKKRKRRRRRITILLILFLAGLITFLVKSPYFIINNVEISGMEKIPLNLIDTEIDGIKGSNIFIFNSQEIKEILSYQEYFDKINIKRKLPDKIIIEIQEKNPEINYLKNGVVSLLTEDGIVLEIGANSLEDGCTLIDDVDLPALGENIYKEDEEKSKFLSQFRDLQKRNINNIVLDTINMTDMKNIRSKYNNLEIRLGYRDLLKNKLNIAINIIEEGNLEDKKGYIDVAMPDKPIINIR